MNCDIFHTVDGRQILMVVNRISSGSIEFTLTNTSYEKSRNKQIRRLACILAVYATSNYVFSYHIAIHIAFLSLVFLQLYFLFDLVQCGKPASIISHDT